MAEISNRPIPSEFRDKLYSVVKPEDILFIVVGDLNLNGKYAESMAVFLKDRVITFDECLDVEYKETKYFYLKSLCFSIHNLYVFQGFLDSQI